MKSLNNFRPCASACVAFLVILRIEFGAALRLTFPDIKDGVITAAENSEIRIRFGVADLDGVTGYFSITLEIRNDSSMNQKGKVLCVLFYYTSTASFTTDEKGNCVAPPEADTVLFTKTVSRQDDKAMLTWRTQRQAVVETNIRLNVTYPPTITSLTFTGASKFPTKIVQKGEMLRLTCSWINGNPPRAVRLLHSKRQQVMMETYSSSKNNLTYDLTPVTCNHTGVFTCQAADAEVNRSVTLLVQYRCRLLGLGRLSILPHSQRNTYPMFPHCLASLTHACTCDNNLVRDAKLLLCQNQAFPVSPDTHSWEPPPEPVAKCLQ